MTKTPSSVEPIFVSVKDAARMLAVTPWQVYRLLEDDKIESQYQGRRRLVRLTSLRDYADSLPTEKTEKSESA